MVAFDYIVLGLLVLLVLVLFTLIAENRKLKSENRMLGEMLEVKDTTIHNLEASTIAVEDVIENLSITDEVMAGIEAGLSKEEVSGELDIPISKIELIIKFDKIIKEQKRDR